MKVIFLNRYFYPDLSATSKMLTDLAVHLAKRGHEVHVICSRQLYESPVANLAIDEQVRGVQVHRIWTSRFGRTNLPGRTVDYLSYYLLATIRLYLLTDSHTIVVAKTDPPLISVPASWVTRWRGARLVNWLQDVFPEVAVELGVKGLGGRFGGWVRRLRDTSLRTAAMNVAISERMAEKVKGYGVATDKVRVIPNWADGTNIVPLRMGESPLRKLWGLEGKFVVGYSGNMGRAHDFDTLLRAAVLLRANKAISFLFVGGGNQRAYVQREVIRLGLDNFVFQPYQSREMLAQSLGASDIHLVSLLPQLEGVIMPSKIYGILAAGRTTIFVGAKDGELANFLGAKGCGVSVNIGDAADFANVILALSREPERIFAMGSEARRIFDSRFDKEISLALWREAILDAA
ncbi:MAG: glycosyltransferase family 4 protein [Nitrosomonadales bacterium]|nr:glycosyltransferase family 4 protein [Nitrosomonadales bacterium]